MIFVSSAIDNDDFLESVKKNEKEGHSSSITVITD
jgi:hypothetical protein